MKKTLDERIRVQFDMDRGSVKKLDDLRERTLAPSRADVMRRALGLYQWFLDSTDKGGRLIMEENGEKFIVRFSNLTTD